MLVRKDLNPLGLETMGRVQYRNGLKISKIFDFVEVQIPSPALFLFDNDLKII